MKKDTLYAFINDIELINKKIHRRDKIKTDLVFAAGSFTVQYSSCTFFIYEDAFQMPKNFLEIHNIVNVLSVFEKMTKSYCKYNDILRH